MTVIARKQGRSARKQRLKLIVSIAAAFLLRFIAPQLTLASDGLPDKDSRGRLDYTIKVLENDFPEMHYRPVAISDDGEVLFQADLPGRCNCAFLWRNGKMIDIGSLGYKFGMKVRSGLRTINDPETIARAMNSNGQVTGQSVTSEGYTHAFLWEEGKMLDLGTLGGNTSRAFAINNKGQVVGTSEDANGTQRSFVWDKKSGLRDLGIDAKGSRPIAINDKGQVLGTAGREYDYLWQDGNVVVLKDAVVDRHLALNNLGDVVGVGSSGAYVQHAGKWQKIALQRFDRSCRITGFTDNGMVSGCGTYDYYITGFLWREGVTVEARDLAPAGNKWDFSGSLPLINSKGQVVMKGMHEGKIRTVVLTPEPRDTSSVK